MKTLKQALILLTSMGLIFSCTKENFESPHQNGISEVEKQQIRESSEFIEIQSLNSALLVDIIQKLLSTPKLIDNIIEQNYTDSEIIEKLEITDKLPYYDQRILDLSQNIVSEHSVLKNLNLNEQRTIINELLNFEEVSSSKVNTFTRRNSNRNNNPCQEQFERDFQYIHGQYDSAIMGVGISITSGLATLNPLPIQIGAGVSLWAVGRAIYNIAVAIDDYNDCMEGGGDRGEDNPGFDPGCIHVQTGPSDNVVTYILCG